MYYEYTKYYISLSCHCFIIWIIFGLIPEPAASAWPGRRGLLSVGFSSPPVLHTWIFLHDRARPNWAMGAGLLPAYQRPWHVSPPSLQTLLWKFHRSCQSKSHGTSADSFFSQRTPKHQGIRSQCLRDCNHFLLSQRHRYLQQHEAMQFTDSSHAMRISAAAFSWRNTKTQHLKEGKSKVQSRQALRKPHKWT